MSRLLEGIRVLELGSFVAVPAAGTILADLGAEVVKVEHPVTGDPGRGFDVNPKGVITHEGGLNISFELLNRGKKSIAVDLTSLSGQEIIHRLANHFDIVVTNLTPHRQERYRVRYEDLSTVNEGLIYVVLTGYGMEGPEKNRSGFDYAAFWARSGLMGMLGQVGTPPVQERPAMGDLTTALSLTTAVGMALFERSRSGKGQLIETSLLHTGMWVMGTDLVVALKDREPVRRNLRTDVINPIFNFYEAKDGKWMQLVMVHGDKYWPRFCRALGIEELIDDPRFDSLKKRSENNVELIDLLDQRFAEKTRDEWAGQLDGEGCMWGPIQTLDEVIADPQAAANGYFLDILHPSEGGFRLVSPPLKFYRTPGETPNAAPEFGQHTEEQLLSVGYTWDEIAGLRDEGAIV